MALHATFFPASNAGSQLGYGSLKVEGFSINYVVYSSAKSESGIFVALPSRKKIVNGQQVMKDGRPEYVSEVFIDRDTRFAVDEAVKNAMYNKGITLETVATTTPSPSHSFNTDTTPTKIPDTSAKNPVVEEEEELPF